MNKFYVILFALAACFSANAQEQTQQAVPSGTVEKSMINIQTGIVGFWASYEARLSNEWTLRTEAGLELGYYETYEPGSLAKNDDGSILLPTISVEPRWYYNIGKRSEKGKYTANNSANFLTVAVKYYPDLFLIGNAPDYVYMPDQISFIPKWGMRRSIAKSNFNYELGGGFGYVAFLESEKYMKHSDNFIIDLHIRIGYTF